MAVRQMLVAGRYRLLEPVGAGGMGRVWLARDEMLHRDVAVKEIVPPDWMTDAEQHRLHERTLREARSAARLNHPHVVRIYDVAHAAGLSWIVMEYVQSRSLHQVLNEEGPYGPPVAARIGLAVLDALAAAHQAGVLHRDVKPHNVLIGTDGRVVLTDFGLATFVDDGSVTMPGLIVGSPQYVSPERARDGASTVESDLWSLGATLYAAVEGRSPYARETAMATLAALATDPPDPPTRAGPLAPVLSGLLRHDPATRLTVPEIERRLRMIVSSDPRDIPFLPSQRDVRREAPRVADAPSSSSGPASATGDRGRAFATASEGSGTGSSRGTAAVGGRVPSPLRRPPHPAEPVPDLDSAPVRMAGQPLPGEPGGERASPRPVPEREDRPAPRPSRRGGRAVPSPPRDSAAPPPTAGSAAPPPAAGSPAPSRAADPAAPSTAAPFTAASSLAADLSARESAVGSPVPEPAAGSAAPGPAVDVPVVPGSLSGEVGRFAPPITGSDRFGSLTGSGSARSDGAGSASSNSWDRSGTGTTRSAPGDAGLSDVGQESPDQKGAVPEGAVTEGAAAEDLGREDLGREDAGPGDTGSVRAGSARDRGPSGPSGVQDAGGTRSSAVVVPGTELERRGPVTGVVSLSTGADLVPLSAAAAPSEHVFRSEESAGDPLFDDAHHERNTESSAVGDGFGPVQEAGAPASRNTGEVAAGGEVVPSAEPEISRPPRSADQALVPFTSAASTTRPGRRPRWRRMSRRSVSTRLIQARLAVTALVVLLIGGSLLAGYVAEMNRSRPQVFEPAPLSTSPSERPVPSPDGPVPISPPTGQAGPGGPTRAPASAGISAGGPSAAEPWAGGDSAPGPGDPGPSREGRPQASAGNRSVAATGTSVAATGTTSAAAPATTLPVATASGVTASAGPPPGVERAGDFPHALCEAPPPAGLPATPRKGAPRGVNGWSLQTGWSYFGDGAGFHIAVPDGWSHQRIGDTHCFRSPRHARVMSLDVGRDPAEDPLAAARAEEQRLATSGGLSGYALVGIAPVPLLHRAADWEYRYRSPSGVIRHAAVRWFVMDGRSYVLGWSTPETSWQPDLSKIQMIRSTFYSSRATASRGSVP